MSQRKAIVMAVKGRIILQLDCTELGGDKGRNDRVTIAHQHCKEALWMSDIADWDFQKYHQPKYQTYHASCPDV